MKERPNYPVALTIAGSDSSGGAGIQTDLRVFTVMGVYGASVVTAVTAQDTCGVRALQVMPAPLVDAQLKGVLGDFPVGAVKTGMLGDAGVVRAVARGLRDYSGPVVVDPVAAATAGEPLLTPEGLAALREDLLPLAALVTPNLPEASLLTGIETPVEGAGDREAVLEIMRNMAVELLKWGPRAVLIKGGHLPAGCEALDLLLAGGRSFVLNAPRLASRHTHGTGCTFSAAITAGLARGLDLEASARLAKRFVTEAIQSAPGLGKGHGPVDHLVWHGRQSPWEETWS